MSTCPSRSLRCPTGGHQKRESIQCVMRLDVQNVQMSTFLRNIKTYARTRADGGAEAFFDYYYYLFLENGHLDISAGNARHAGVSGCPPRGHRVDILDIELDIGSRHTEQQNISGKRQLMSARYPSTPNDKRWPTGCVTSV